MELVNNSIDAYLRKVRAALTQSTFLAFERFFMVVAGYATPFAAVVGVLISVVIAIKVDSFLIFSSGFLWIGALVFCYYIGSKARLLCLSTIKNNQSSVSNQAFLDIGAFTCLTTAVSLLAGGIYLGIKSSSLVAFLLCAGGSVTMAYLMWLMLQPQLISISVESSTSAGMDGISNVVLVYKMYLRVSTVLFGVLPAVGAALMVHSLFNAFEDPVVILQGGILGAIGFALVIGGLLAPSVIYTSFIFSYLFFDVFRAILVVGKLATQISNKAAAKTAPTESQDIASATADDPNFSDDPATGANGQVSTLSSAQAKKVLIGIAVTCLAVFFVIQGKAYYVEYQAKKEAARMAEEQKRAEEELASAQRAEEERKAAEIRKEEAERLAREAQLASDLLTQARKHIGSSGLDMLLEPLIHTAAREAMRTEDNMRAVENFMFNATNVVEADGQISVSGCSRDNCEAQKVIITVDSATAKVGLAVKTGDRVMYFGYSEADSPTVVKKWVISLR